MHRLSDELTVRKGPQGGVLLYLSSDPEIPVAAFDVGEMIELFAWYWEKAKHPDADLAAYVVRSVRIGRLAESTAVKALRALLMKTELRASYEAVANWIWGAESPFQGAEEREE